MSVVEVKMYGDTPEEKPEMGLGKREAVCQSGFIAISATRERS